MHFFNNTALKVEVKAKRSLGDYQDAIRGHFEAMTRYKMFQVGKLLETRMKIVGHAPLGNKNENSSQGS